MQLGLRKKVPLSIDNRTSTINRKIERYYIGLCSSTLYRYIKHKKKKKITNIEKRNNLQQDKPNKYFHYQIGYYC